MSYTTGLAASFSEVRTALLAAMITGGWTDEGSDVYTKGDAVVGLTASATAVLLQGYSNYSAGPVGPCGRVVSARNPKFGLALTFPFQYHIHVLDNPDEVYCFINFNTDYWCHLAFGCSPVADLPGTGNWVAGTAVAEFECTYMNFEAAGSGGQNYQTFSRACPGFFWSNNNSSDGGSGANYYIHHGFDSRDWSLPEESQNASRAIYTLMNLQPNEWNGQNTLIPIMPCVGRPAGLFSIAAQFAHSRYVRNNYLDDGEVISLGADDWKCYPFYKKDITLANGEANGNASGTYALAIRHEV